ncbi:MAG: sugar-binding protein, partial [Planctomycetota bacterium]
SSRERRLHVAQDSVIFPDSSALFVFGRVDGRPRTEGKAQLSRVLVEKGSFTSALVDGRLVLLSDGGDCAFTSDSALEGPSAEELALERVRQYLASPGNGSAVLGLALSLFQKGSTEGLETAIYLLDRALLSEDVLLGLGGDRVRDLFQLLDGFKQEAMKQSPPPIVTASKFSTSPVIDGELDEAWNYAFRIRLASPQYIGTIARTGGSRSWEGEEDLSGVLYTGWDDENFYFALDVDDDALRAFDRDAEHWKGDCLIIGLDPEGNGGYRQGPTDQLMTLALTVPKRQKRDKDGEDPDGENGEDGADGGEDPEKDEAESKKKPDGQFSVKKKDDDSGAIYEVALPWETFSSRFTGDTKPGRGESFGLSLLLIDDDTGSGATKTLSINPCHLLPPRQKQIWVWKYLIPEFFPRVVLR